MRNIVIILFFLISLKSFTQVVVGTIKTNNFKSVYDKEAIKQFKNTETIFVLSNIFEKEDYEKILKDTWNVTPYKIVTAQDFVIENYLSNKFTIVNLRGSRSVVSKQIKGSGVNATKSNVLLTYVDFRVYDNQSIKDQLSELSSIKKEEKRRKKRKRIILGNSTSIARFFVYPKKDIVNELLQVGWIYQSDKEKKEKNLDYFYNKDTFYNYKPGLLKNYFQKINNQLVKEEKFDITLSNHTDEIKSLSSQTLYIPSYLSIRYNMWIDKHNDNGEESIHKIFKKYEFDYKIIKNDNISDKIMAGDNFYYLRYVRNSAAHFIEIINSKSGEIIYKKYKNGGLKSSITAKHISDINTKIKKTLKK